MRRPRLPRFWSERFLRYWQSLSRRIGRPRHTWDFLLAGWADRLDRLGLAPSERAVRDERRAYLALTALEPRLVPATPVLSIRAIDAQASEAGLSTALFRFMRTGDTSDPLTATYTTTGTAVLGSDYSLPGTVEFAAGEAFALVYLTPTADGTVEPTETAVLTLEEGTGYTVGESGAATATITDGDTYTVGVSAADATATEGSGTDAAELVFSRNGTLGNTTVYYAGSASGTGPGYSGLGTSVVIADGADSATVTVTATSDGNVTGDRDLSVSLTPTGGSGYELGGSAANVTLVNTDTYTVSVDATEIEMSTPLEFLSTGRFTFRRNGTLGDLTVHFTVGGTAVAGDMYDPSGDYMNIGTTIVIPNGRNSVSLEVYQGCESSVGASETIIVTLDPNVNYTVGTAGNATINDEHKVLIDFFMTSDTLYESDTSGGAHMRIYRTGPTTSNLTVTVSYDPPYTDPYYPVNGTDYLSLPTTITIPAGQSYYDTPVVSINDSEPEFNAYAYLFVADTSVYEFNRWRADNYLFYMVDDDWNGNEVSISSVSNAVENGSSGQFVVSRNWSAGDATVTYSVGGSATAGTDYTALPGTIVIPDGQTTATITLNPIDDSALDAGERVLVTLLSGSDYLTYSYPATLTIADDETNHAPALAPLADETLSPGGTLSFSASATDSDAPGQTLTYSLVNAPAGASISPTGSFAWAPTEDQAGGVYDVTVRVTDGYAPGPLADVETFHVTVQPTVTIRAADPSASELGASTGSYVLTRTGRTDAALTVYLTLGGDATEGDDYEGIGTTVEIAAGARSAVVVLHPVDDAEEEGPEEVVLTLASHSAYAIGAAGNATVTVRDNDAPLDVRGGVVVSVEGYAFSGMVALVTDFDLHDEELDVDILWGDGTRSDGTIVEGEDGALEVHGNHTYSHDGAYPLQLFSEDILGRHGLAGGLGYVLARSDHQEQSVLLSATASSEGTFDQDLSVFFPGGAYSLTATGTVDYTVTEVVAEPDQRYTLTRSGTLDVTLGEWGSTGDEVQTSLHLVADGVAAQSATVEAPGRHGTATDTGTDTVTLTQTGDAGVGSYSWTQSESIGSTVSQSITAADGTYVVTGSGSSSLAGEGETNFSGGTYWKTLTGTETSERTEAGTRGSETYSRVRTATGNTVSVSETGSPGGRTFDRDEEHGGAYTLTETVSDAAGGGGATWTGNATDSRGAWGQEGGLVTFTRTGTDAYTGASSRTVTGAVTNATAHGQSTSGRSAWGDEDGGEFFLSVGNSDTSTSTATTTNQGVVAVAVAVSQASNSTSEWGNMNEGVYSLSTSGGSGATSTSVAVNQGVTVTGTATQTWTGTSWQEGDRWSGDYTLGQTSTSVANASEGWTRQGTTTAGGVTGLHTLGGAQSSAQTGTSTLDRTGNEITGSYSLHESYTDSATVGDLSTSDTSSTATSGGSSEGATATAGNGRDRTGTLDRTGNALTGSYSSTGAYDDTLAATSGSTWTRTAGGAAGTESGGGTETAGGSEFRSGTSVGTGNEHSGSYSLTETWSGWSTQTSSASGGTSGTGADGGGQSSTYVDSTTADQANAGTTTLTGNAITGTRTLHEVAAFSATTTAVSSATNGRDTADGAVQGQGGSTTQTQFEFGSSTTDQTASSQAGTSDLRQESHRSATVFAVSSAYGSSAGADGAIGDQNATTFSTGYEFGHATTSQTANALTGTYSLSETSSGSSTVTGVSTGTDSWALADETEGDGTSDAVSIDSRAWSATATRSGNQILGEYTLHDESHTSATVTAVSSGASGWVGVDLSYRSDGGDATNTTVAVDHSTADRTGSEFLGDFSLSQSGSHSATVIARSETSNAWGEADGASGEAFQSSSSTSYEFGSDTLHQTADPLAGYSSRSETSGRSATLFSGSSEAYARVDAEGSTEGHASTAQGTSYQFGSSTASTSGNDVSGTFNLYQASTSSATAFGGSTDTLSWDGADGATEGATSTATSTSYVFGSGTVTQTSATDGTYTVVETGSSSATMIAGDTRTGDWVAADLSSGSDTAASTSTSSQVGSSTSTQIGSANGDYSLAQSGANTSTLVVGSSETHSWLGADGSSEDALVDSGSTNGATATNTLDRTGSASGSYSLFEGSGSSATGVAQSSSSNAWVGVDGSSGDSSASASQTSSQSDSSESHGNGSTAGDYTLTVTTGRSLSATTDSSDRRWDAAADGSTQESTGTTTRSSQEASAGTSTQTGAANGAAYQTGSSSGSATVSTGSTGTQTWEGADGAYGTSVATANSTRYDFGAGDSTQTLYFGGGSSLAQTGSSTATVVAVDAALNTWVGADLSFGSDFSEVTSTAYQVDSGSTSRNGTANGTYGLSDSTASSATVYATSSHSSTASNLDGSTEESVGTGVSTSFQVGSSTTTRGGAADGSSLLTSTSEGSATAFATTTDTQGWLGADGSGGGVTATATSTSYESGSGGSTHATYSGGGYSLSETSSGSATVFGTGTTTNTWLGVDLSDGTDTSTRTSTSYESGSSTSSQNAAADGSYGTSGSSSHSATVYALTTALSSWLGADGAFEGHAATTTSTAYDFGSSSSGGSGSSVGTASLSASSGGSSSVFAVATDVRSWTGADGSAGGGTVTTASTEYQFGSSGSTQTQYANGSYSLRETSSGSATTVADSTETSNWEGVDGTEGSGTATATSTGYDFGSGTRDRTGTAGGSYSLHEESSQSSTAFSGGSQTNTVTDGTWSEAVPAAWSSEAYGSGANTHNVSGTAAGTYSLSDLATSGSTVYATDTNRGLGVTFTTTETGSATTAETGDAATGPYTRTVTATSDRTAPVAGSDSRGTFTGTETDHADSTTTGTGNTRSGQHTATTVASDNSTTTSTGGDGDTGYTRSVTTGGSSTATQWWDTALGTTSQTLAGTGSATTTENGEGPSTTYTLVETSHRSVSESEQTNTRSGAYTQTHTETSGASLHAVGVEGTLGSYTLDKVTDGYGGQVWSESGMGGIYSLSGTAGETSTAVETSVHGTHAASFTEILGEDGTFSERGDQTVGDYDRQDWGSRSANFVQAGDHAAGSYFVTEGSAGTFSRTELGNTQTGGYTLRETASTDYSATEAVSGASPFTLTVSGTDAGTKQEAGDVVTGEYSRGEAGTDLYVLTESGTLPGGGFTETVTGTDTYAATETGNEAKGTHERTTTGGGSYVRTVAGPGATLGNATGANAYTLGEEGNARVGRFSQAKTGTDRYGLVEAFVDVSNAEGGATPGHVTFYSHGLPFRDPPPNGEMERPWYKRAMDTTGAIFLGGSGLIGRAVAPETTKSVIQAVTNGTVKGAEGLAVSAVPGVLAPLVPNHPINQLAQDVKGVVQNPPTTMAGLQNAAETMQRYTNPGMKERIDGVKVLVKEGDPGPLVEQLTQDVEQGAITIFGMRVGGGAPRPPAALPRAIPVKPPGPALPQAVPVQPPGAALPQAIPVQPPRPPANGPATSGAPKTTALNPTACFVAGTPLLTASGFKPIENFVVGDTILSRSEHDNTASIQAKEIEAIFVRAASTLQLTVSGRIIETTREHPFYVIGKGWCLADRLEKGDVLASHNATLGVVENVTSTGEIKTVYNMRVADWHTYFVGCDEWGFSVWAHNALCAEQVRVALETQGAKIPAGDPRLQTIADHLNAGNKAAAKDLIMKEGLSQKKALTALDDLEFAARPPAAPAAPEHPAAPAPLNLKQRVEQAVRGEFKVRGDPGHSELSLVDLGKPHVMANPEAGLGANQIRYQATFRRADGSTFNVSVNFDPETGLFGTIKPASGKK